MNGAAARLCLVLASNNAGKLAELRALFASLAVELVAQPELGLAERGIADLIRAQRLALGT